MQGKHGSCVTDLILLIRPTTNQENGGKIKFSPVCIKMKSKPITRSLSVGLNRSLEDTQSLL